MAQTDAFAASPYMCFWAARAEYVSRDRKQDRKQVRACSMAVAAALSD